MKFLFIPILYLSIFILPLQADLFDIFSTNIKQNIPHKIKAKELYIKYTNYPSEIYSQQRFTVEIESRITNSELIPRKSSLRTTKHILINRFKPESVSQELEKFTSSSFSPNQMFACEHCEQKTRCTNKPVVYNTTGLFLLYAL